MYWTAPDCAAQASVAVPPNLVVILADDMGYSDPHCFGGEMETPALDRMASNGLRLARFENGGMCVVSRAMLLSGKWWPRSLPDFARSPLLPERLHAAGYRTALIGKWHLDGDPMDRGFDHFFGYLGGFSDYFGGSPDYRLDRKPFKDFGPGFVSTDAFSDRAVEFIRGPAGPEPRKPFFLYLSYQAPHNPLEAPREDILKHRGTYLGGWQAVREARFKRQKELGLVPADASLPAYPQNLPDWNSLTAAQRDLEDLRMSVFAAMIERMDRGIGRVIEAIEQAGQAKNTLVLFLSDNGADSFSLLDQTMLRRNLLPGDRGSNWQLGTGWAYVSVTPWRLYKISQHAGGITSGAIASWPGVLGNPGTIAANPVHVVDVMATFLDLAGASSGPGLIAPGNEQASAGESFRPLLEGKAWQRKEPRYFQYRDNRAIRTRDWTMAEVDGSGWQLFDLGKDPLETNDLARQKPEVLADLAARWTTWWREESGQPTYVPITTRGDANYHPQGDRGTGSVYLPSAMPEHLSGRYPLP